MYQDAVLLSLAAGLAITLGGWAASKKLCHFIWNVEELKHTITAVGGGALLSAIAFVLIPEGIEHQSKAMTMITFAAGGITFMFVDRHLARSGSSASQMIAMLLDFVPEAIILGVAINSSLQEAVFIAVIIMVQNFPEGYSAYTEMIESKGMTKKKLLTWFLLIGLTGPIYVSLGCFVFIDNPQVLSAMMTFSAGGILYLLFQDIAPNVRQEKHWLPPLGAVAGFMVGLAGYIFME